MLTWLFTIHDALVESYRVKYRIICLLCLWMIVNCYKATVSLELSGLLEVPTSANLLFQIISALLGMKSNFFNIIMALYFSCPTVTLSELFFCSILSQDPTTWQCATCGVPRVLSLWQPLQKKKPLSLVITHTHTPSIYPYIFTYSLTNIVSSFLQAKPWKSFVISVMLHLGWLLRRWNCNRSRFFSDKTTLRGEWLTKPWHPYLDRPSAVTPLICTLSSSSQYPHLHRPPSLTAASCTWLILLRLVKQTDVL